MTNRTEEESFSTAARSPTTFGSLRSRNFRVMATGQLFANIAYWMVYTSLNWLVLGLTGSAAAVGLTGALLNLPVLVVGMVGGLLADRYPKRRILLFYYLGLPSLVGILAGLAISQVAQTWQVQLVAAGLGTVWALGLPAQQSFIAETAGPAHLRNAIGISSSVIQLAALAGPAVGGILIGAAGSGWSFLVATACYVPPLVALSRVRVDELHTLAPVPTERGQLRAGLRYAVSRPDVLWPTVLVAVFGMFTNNLSVTLAVYAKSVFDLGPGGYGLLSAIVAVGSVAGALIAARQRRTRLRTLLLLAALLSALYILAAAAPTQLIFYALLLGIGASGLMLQTSAMSTVQLAAHARIRGRIVSIYVLAWSGGIAIGGPLVGNVDQHLGPEAGMLLAGVLPGTVTLLIAARLAIHLKRSRRSTAQPQVTPSQNTPTCGDAPKKTAHGNSSDSGSEPWAGLNLEKAAESSEGVIEGTER